MARRIGKTFSRLYRYWFEDRGIGRQSRAGAIGSWASLQPFRYFVASFFASFFVFDAPEWSKGVRTIGYSPSIKYRWHDFVNPVYWLTWGFGFIHAWLFSRPYMSLGPGLPAVAATVVLGILLFQQHFERSNWRDAAYRKHLADAVARNDDETARVALMNLVASNPTQIDYRVQQALLEEKLGHEEVATKAMASLALTKESSIAAYWLVKKQYSLDDLAQWAADKHKQFQHLMAIVFKSVRGQAEVEARTLMAQYYMAINVPSEALRMLEAVATRNQELLLLTATLHGQLGNQPALKQWGERAVHYYQEKLLSSPNSTEHRVRLAQSLILLHREEEAARMLSDAHKLMGDAQLLQASGEAYAVWANRIAATEPSTQVNLIRRLQLLKRAIDAAPKNGVVLDSLVQAAIQCAENGNGQVETLRTALLQGLDSESMHFVQGTVDLMRGDVEKANMHLGLIATDNKLPGVLNNMAVVLYQRENPDLEKALSLSNAAIERMPNFPAMRETRGQILLKMKEYKKAIPDLEFALQDKSLVGPVHRSLAEAYEGLGQKEIAEEHRALAELLQNPAK